LITASGRDYTKKEDTFLLGKKCKWFFWGYFVEAKDSLIKSKKAKKTDPTQ